MIEKNLSVDLKKRKQTRSKWVVGMYICAGISLIVAAFMVYYSITYVMDYYESYGMSITEGIKDVIQYIISCSGSCIGFAVVFFAAGHILSKLESLSSSEEMMDFQETAEDETADLCESETESDHNEEKEE